jgi:hypothetical protein
LDSQDFFFEFDYLLLRWSGQQHNRGIQRDSAPEARGTQRGLFDTKTARVTEETVRTERKGSTTEAGEHERKMGQDGDRLFNTKKSRHPRGLPRKTGPQVNGAAGRRALSRFVGKGGCDR